MCKNNYLCACLFFIFGLLNNTFAQDQNQQDIDTIIVIKKKYSKQILEEYKNIDALQTDLMPDNSKNWMVTDRPHIAETPHLVPKNYLQIEMGYNSEYRNTNLIKINEITYNTTLLRLGLSKKIELRAEIAYLETNTKTSKDSLINNKNGFSGLSLGSKIHLVKAKGIIPETTLLYGITLPYFGSNHYKPNYTSGEIKFLFLNRITKFYEFEYNLGYQWEGEEGNTVYAYALNNEFEVNHKLFFFAEIYGYFKENGDGNNRFSGTFTEDHRANGGIWYLFSSDFQLDFSGGVGLNQNAPNYYFSFGISNRISLKKKKH